MSIWMRQYCKKMRTDIYHADKPSEGWCRCTASMMVNDKWILDTKDPLMSSALSVRCSPCCCVDVQGIPKERAGYLCRIFVYNQSPIHSFPNSSWSCQCPCRCSTAVKRYLQVAICTYIFIFLYLVIVCLMIVSISSCIQYSHVHS